MENIKLDNGLYLNRVYGKYKPNLTFLSKKKLVQEYGLLGVKEGDRRIFEHVKKPSAVFNANFDGVVSIAEGRFSVSKKGTSVFNLTKNGDLLIVVEWGGSFNRSRGRGDISSSTNGVKYYRRASSNGGGSGYTFIIVPIGFNMQVRNSDI